MKTDLFPETIKIGAHTLAIREHEDTELSGAIFNWPTSEITIMSRHGRYCSIHPIYLLDRFMCALLKAIVHYSSIKDYGWENRVRVGQGIMQAIRSNLDKYGIDGKNVANVDGAFDPPESIDICSFRIKFFIQDADRRIEHKVSAHCDLKEESITVFNYFENCKIQSDTQKWTSLWHEIFHAIFSANSLDDISECESLIESHSQWWVMVLRDNPEFVKCIKNILSDNGKEQDNA